MKILTFNLDNEVYAAHASNVISISQAMPISPVPLSADYILGVVYLRGQVVNILDVKKLFKLKHTDDAVNKSKESCLIFLENGGALFGFLVDSVCDVIEIEGSSTADKVDPSGEASSYVDTIIKVKDDLVFLLSTAKLSQALLSTSLIKKAA